MDLLNELKKNPFVLAPMAGITDCSFRSFMRSMGCGPMITELVSATGLKYKSEKTERIMAFSSDQHPVGVQIFGETPEVLGEAAKKVEEMGADFVDLNFGCPVPKVVKKGGGSAVLKDLKALTSVLKAVKSAVEIPVTIKIRTGWDHHTRNSVEVCKIAYEEGITWVGIHGRTRSAGYSGLADWDYISEVTAKSSIPILGNGDINSAAMANRRLVESGCDGVMIGRGCLKNPWIFAQSLLVREAQDENAVVKVSRNFNDLFSNMRAHIEKFNDERVVMLQTKKLASWYSAGYPGSASFRKNIFQIKDKLTLYYHVDEFFGGISHLDQSDTSGEPFLMGGHG